jgi:hypothetical protein
MGNLDRLNAREKKRSKWQTVESGLLKQHLSDSKMKTDHFLGLNLQLLAKYKGLQWDKVLQLEEVQGRLGISLEEMQAVTEDALHSEPYSQEEICRCLGISLEELRTQILSPNTQDGESTGVRRARVTPSLTSGRFSNYPMDPNDCKVHFRGLENICVLTNLIF